MTIDPQTVTYIMIGLIGAIAMLVVVIIFVAIFRRAPGVGPGSLTAVRDWLMGRKTYILAGALMALGLAQQQGYIDLPTYDRYVEFITGGAIITFKAALGRVEARLKQIKAAAPPVAPPVVPAPFTPAPTGWRP